jgi:hypothetical protein
LGPLPATRLASRKILIEQNIKKRTGPALWVLSGPRIWCSVQCTVNAVQSAAGGRVECQILGLWPQIGRTLQAQNTITTALCWSHSTSSLMYCTSKTNIGWDNTIDQTSFLCWHSFSD